MAVFDATPSPHPVAGEDAPPLPKFIRPCHRAAFATWPDLPAALETPIGRDVRALLKAKKVETQEIGAFYDRASLTAAEAANERPCCARQPPGSVPVSV